MRIKFPKKIIIGDVEFLIKTDPKRVGGEFNFWNEDSKTKKPKMGDMIIGTKLLEACPIRVLSTIIHELKEAIQEVQCVRYQRPDSRESYEFHYTHKEHDDLCSRLAGLLSQFIV